MFAGIALRRIKQGKRTGRGLAIAAIVINVLWVAIIVAAIAFSGDDTETPNADRFQGERKEIAAVIDDFENAAQSDDATRLCSLMTPAHARTLGEGEGGCEGFWSQELEGSINADIEIKSIRLGSAGHATAFVEEGGDPVRVQMSKRGAAWKIAQFSTGSG